MNRPPALDLAAIPDKYLFTRSGSLTRAGRAAALIAWLREHDMQPTLLDIEHERARRQRADRDRKETP